jgi:hypothetical protein
MVVYSDTIDTFKIAYEKEKKLREAPKNQCSNFQLPNSIRRIDSDANAILWTV